MALIIVIKTNKYMFCLNQGDREREMGERERKGDFHKERSNRSVINMLIIWGYLGESVNGQSVVYFEPLTMIFLWIKSGVWRYG